MRLTDKKKSSIIYSIAVALLVITLWIICANPAKSGTAPTPITKWSTIQTPVRTDSTDVTVRLQAELNIAWSRAGSVYLDTGIILLTDSIVIPQGVELYANNTRVDFVDAAKGFVMRDNTTISGFGRIRTRWTGASQTGNDEFGAPISIGNYSTGEGYNNIDILNLTVQSSRAGGADITITGNSYNVNVGNIQCQTVDDSTRYGIRCINAQDGNDSTYHPYNLTIDNIWIDTLDPLDTNGYAVSLHGVGGAIVSNVQSQFSYIGIDVHADTYGYTHAISTNSFGNQTYPSIKIDNCHFNDIWTWGARITGSVENGSSPDTAIMPVNFTNCTFTGTSVTAGSGYNGANPTGAMHRWYAKGVIYENCIFYNWTNGANFDEADGVTFVDCIFEQNVYGGFVHSSSFPDNIIFRGCNIQNIHTNGEHGIYVGRAKQVIIDNCTFGFKGDTSMRYPVRVADPAHATIPIVKIINNHVVDMGSAGNTQAYYIQYNPSVAQFYGNTIDSANIDTSNFSTNTDFSDRWADGQGYIGQHPIDSSTGLADGDVARWDDGSKRWQYVAPPGAAGGTADSMGVDTDGDGTVDNYLYSTTAGAFHLKKGANISLTPSGDTLSPALTITSQVDMGGNDIVNCDSADFSIFRVGTISVLGDIQGGNNDVTIESFESIYADTLKTDIANGKIYLDGSNNITFVDGVTSAKTLAELAAAGGGTVDSTRIGNGLNNVTDGTQDSLAAPTDTIEATLGTSVTLTSEVDGILPVANGGSGASSLTDGGILLGSGAGAFTPLGVATNGQIPIGDGATDPVLNEIDGTANEVSVANGAGTITVSLPEAVIIDSLILGRDTLSEGNIPASHLCMLVHNASGATLDAGTPVYLSGATGEVPNVDSARSDNAALMPSVGMIWKDILNGNEGLVVWGGKIGGLNTNAFAVQDDVYVAPTGGWTITKPTGTDLIQKIGIISRVNASQGEIQVTSTGRSNDLPNIPSTNYWVGNGSGVPTAVAMSSDATMDNTGAVTVANDSHDHTSTTTTLLLDEVGNPGGDKNFTMSGNHLQFRFNAPADSGFIITAIGAFSGQLFHVHQHTGNPSGGTLVDIEADDPDVIPLTVTGANDTNAVLTGGTVYVDSINAIALNINGKAQTGDGGWAWNMIEPNLLYDGDTDFMVTPRTGPALTITRIDVSCDADPTTELDFNLYYADAFIGKANATLIVAMNTTAGVATITSFTDATVPANKAIYVLFDADPDAAITQVGIAVTWDYD